jgi:glycerophosphoryl diester phosphodiesterase
MGAAVPSLFLVIGHRGAAGLAPEHTRASFERALAVGVDMIELDVQLTRDGHLVVMHDVELGRTVPASGRVRECSLAELKQLDAGGWFGAEFRGEPPLSLAEVFDLLRGRASVNVEIKSPQPDWAATAQELSRVLHEARTHDTTVVSSFQMEALAAVRGVLGEVRLGVLWQRAELAPAWEWTARLRASSFHPFMALVNDDLVRAAHERGLHVHTWTVNDEDEMARLAGTNVDGIISDFPDRLLRARDRLALRGHA